MTSSFGLAATDREGLVRAFADSHAYMVKFCSGKVTPAKLAALGKWANSPEVTAFLDLFFSGLGKKNKNRLVLEWSHEFDYFDEKLRDFIPFLFERPELAVTPRIGKDNHLVIKGDNLPALLALRPAYEGTVKCILIDPPYLSGNERLGYRDKFSHSAWLTMMALRFRIARDLMSNDASIIVHIDEREQAYLAVLMDQIFGRGARMMNFIWKKKNGGSNNAKNGAIEHEYVLVYGRSEAHTSTLFLARKAELNARFKEEDAHGRFQWDTFKARQANNHYAIQMPDGTVLENDEDGEPISWLRTENRLKKDLAKGDAEYVQNPNGSWRVRYKRRPPKRAGVLPRSLLMGEDYGTTETGGDDYTKVMGRVKGKDFLFPKPVALIKYLVRLATGEGDVVLDFFAGSGTTGQAVLELNAEDGKNRRFVLVTDAGLAATEGVNQAVSAKEKSRAIDIAEDITRERLRRVITGDVADKSGAMPHDAGLQFFEVGYLPTHGTVVVDYTDEGDEVYSDEPVAKAHEALLSDLVPHLRDHANALYGAVTVHQDKDFSVSVGAGKLFLNVATPYAPDVDASLYSRVLTALAPYEGAVSVIATTAVRYEWMDRVAAERNSTCRAVPLGAKMVRHWSVYNALRKEL